MRYLELLYYFTNFSACIRPRLLNAVKSTCPIKCSPILKIMLTYTTQLLNISPISFIMVRLNEFSNLKRERSSSLMYTILQSIYIKKEQTVFFSVTQM